MTKQYCTVLSRLLLALVLIVSGNGSVFAIDNGAHEWQSHHGSSMNSADNHHHQHMSPQQTAQADTDNSEDCFCDDVCCLSYTGFHADAQQSQAVLHDTYSPLETQLYRSVSLDLGTPPPNA
ncbi:MAG: hypothetical protein R3332_10235 [Pseudohongiellaceae bacterium]|nr:hypothetical protein [Pseudohongiellaceae bacterium]